jgi:polyisoprenyl-teichoic acid--peptidoglycan teichoic acid transferase
VSSVTQARRRAPSRSTGRSPTIAALLSFIWPGLGQWYDRRNREALIFAVPVAVILIALIAWLATASIFDLLVPAVALTFLLIIVADAIWRIVAGFHAAWVTGGSGALTRPATGVTLAVLTIIVLLTHLWASAVAWSLYQAPGRIFAPFAFGPSPSVPAGVDPSTGVAPTPGVTPPAADARMNILLTGVDSSSIRSHALNDTLIVVSVDPKTGQVAMLSVPRDIARFEQPDGTKFTGKINELMTYANNHPKEYPNGGMAALTDEIGYLVGVPIHYYASIDLQGFSRLVDAVGGVTVDNPKPIDDPGYGGWTDHRPIGFHLSAGVHHLDGQTALAYARSRKGVGDNDFTRARRQQQLLLALRARLTDPSLLPQLPAIIDAGSRVVQTNFPQDRLSQMLEIASKVTDDNSVKRYVLGPPYAKNPPAGTPGGYQLVPDMDKIAKLSVKLFGADSRYSVAQNGASPAP